MRWTDGLGGLLSNAIRGHLAELGITSAKGRNGMAELLKVITDNDGRIPVIAHFSLDVLARQYATVTAEIGAIEKRIHAWHRSCEESRRLEGIPGVGPIVARGDLRKLLDIDPEAQRAMPTLGPTTYNILITPL